MRVSRNKDQLPPERANIEFTREYFTKRVISEAAVSGLSRVWICGPPKMCTSAASILLAHGYTSKHFLLV